MHRKLHYIAIIRRTTHMHITQSLQNFLADEPNKVLFCQNKNDDFTNIWGNFYSVKACTFTVIAIAFVYSNHYSTSVLRYVHLKTKFTLWHIQDFCESELMVLPNRECSFEKKRTNKI